MVTEKEKARKRERARPGPNRQNKKLRYFNDIQRIMHFHFFISLVYQHDWTACQESQDTGQEDKDHT